MAKFHDGDLDIEFEPSVAALAAATGVHTNARASDVEFRGEVQGKKPVFPAGSVYDELARTDPSVVPAWPGTAHEAPKPRATVPTPASGAGAKEIFEAATEAAVAEFIKAEGGEPEE